MQADELTVALLCDILEGQGLLSTEERIRVASRENAQRAMLLGDSAEGAAGQSRAKPKADAIDIVASLDVPNARDEGTILTAAVLGEAIAQHFELKFLRFDLKQLDLELISTSLTRPFALRNNAIPIGLSGDVLVLAAASAIPRETIEDLRRSSGNEIEVVISAKSDIVAAINAAFPDAADESEPPALPSASPHPAASPSEDADSDLPPRPSVDPPPAPLAREETNDLPRPRSAPSLPRPASEPGVVSPFMKPAVEKHSAPPPPRPSAQPLPRPSSQAQARPSFTPVKVEEPAPKQSNPMLLAGGTLVVGFGLGLITLAIFWNRGDSSEGEGPQDPSISDPVPGESEGPGASVRRPGESLPGGGAGRRPGGSRLHVRVELQNVPSGATVLLDGERISGTVMNVLNDGREHQIEVRAPGQSTWRHTLTPSEDVRINTGLVRREPVRPSGPGPGSRPSDRPRPPSPPPTKAPPQPSIVTDPGF